MSKSAGYLLNIAACMLVFSWQCFARGAAEHSLMEVKQFFNISNGTALENGKTLVLNETLCSQALISFDISSLQSATPYTSSNTIVHLPVLSLQISSGSSICLSVYQLIPAIDHYNGQTGITCQPGKDYSDSPVGTVVITSNTAHVRIALHTSAESLSNGLLIRAESEG